MSPQEKDFPYRKSSEVRKFFKSLEKKGVLPKLTSGDFSAFHGTSKQNADSIISNGFTPTALEKLPEDAVYGEGSYFWDDVPDEERRGGMKAAKVWATERRMFETPQVVKAQLTFERLFDLSEPANQKFFLEVYDWMSTKSQELLKTGVIWEWQAIQFIILACPYLAECDIDGVRCDVVRVLEHEPFGHMTLCVKDAKCIRSLKLV